MSWAWKSALGVVVLGMGLAGPGGAWAASHTFSVTLRGSDAVPHGDRGDSAKATITIDSGKGTICWTFTALKGIGTPERGKIGKAPKAKRGPIVVTLSRPFMSKGCSNAPPGTLTGILKQPATYYVILTNQIHPSGAVRAQL
jgi:hypothetical protein